MFLINSITPRYFDTLGTRLAAGRMFDGRDVESSQAVAIVNARSRRSISRVARRSADDSDARR